jgi:hypothetical protein
MTTDASAAPVERVRRPALLVAEPLLFIPLAGVLGVVVAVILLASAPGTLTLIFAILVALAGTASVIAVVNYELSDADGSHGATP